MASKDGHSEIGRLLIEKGIDINQKDWLGVNALHLASKKGHLELVRLLIEKGIDVNQTTKDGCNALNPSPFV